ncbi:MAG: hypothetical protein K8M05_21905 [Deltaproteobacteria bacterium]|nr:hypothetical protein [Kofleriaceae bacterium]
MRRLAFLLLLSLFACKKSAAPATSRGGDAGPTALDDGGDATNDNDEPDEADVRAGKRTGLGAPDEKPEVATEDFARGLVRATVPWAKVLDRGAGVVELADGAVTHRCGAALDAALAAFAQRATASLDDPGLLYDVACDNVGLAVTIPGVASHAVCSIASPAGEGLEHDLVFVPDAAKGLRLVGVSTTDALATDDAVRDAFDEALGRYGQRCP